MFYIHGYQEYIERQPHFAQKFSERGYDFYAMDNRGHGKSEGKDWLTESVENESDDHFRFHKKVIDTLYKDKKPPCFLLSHSYGGMLTLNGLLRDLHLSE